jgi:hypothetical protein
MGGQNRGLPCPPFEIFTTVKVGDARADSARFLRVRVNFRVTFGSQNDCVSLASLDPRKLTVVTLSRRAYAP